MKEHDYIYEIYKCKSFSKAAANLYMTQPALSAAVKKIEKEMGITIFDRNTQPIGLTYEGLIYIESIEAIRNIESSTKRKLEDISNLKTGSLIISGENFVTSFILPKIITEYSKRYPGIDVEIVESNNPDLKQQLVSEKIDLLISHNFEEDIFESSHLFDEELLLAVPESFEINEKIVDYALDSGTIKNLKKLERAKGVDLSLFKDEMFLMLKPGNDSFDRAKTLFAEAGISPPVRIYLDQLITSYNLACAGLGIALTSNVLVYQSGGHGCKIYKINSSHTRRGMYLGYVKNRYLSNASKAMINTAIDLYR